MSVWMSVFPSSTKKVLEKNARIYFFHRQFRLSNYASPPLVLLYCEKATQASHRDGLEGRTQREDRYSL